MAEKSDLMEKYMEQFQTGNIFMLYVSIVLLLALSQAGGVLHREEILTVCFFLVAQYCLVLSAKYHMWYRFFFLRFCGNQQAVSVTATAGYCEGTDYVLAEGSGLSEGILIASTAG